MNEEQRATLGALVAAARRQRYGTKSAAYQAAGVHSTTWSHIEDGVGVREDRLVAAVRTLWPSSGGDWRKIATDAPADRPLIAYTNRVLLDEFEARLTEIDKHRRKATSDENKEPTTATGRGRSARKARPTVTTPRPTDDQAGIDRS